MVGLFCADGDVFFVDVTERGLEPSLQTEGRCAYVHVHLLKVQCYDVRSRKRKLTVMYTHTYTHARIVHHISHATHHM